MQYDSRISLDPRLSMIAETLGVCACCADIGSDHGRLGAFLLQNHRCEHLCLTDISAASLNKARKLISMLGLDEKTSFHVGNGAQVLDRRVDAAVIAGMGGETIAEIIENSENHLDGARLILQPNVAAPSLRRRMNACGWRITNENLARDGRRIYLVLEARQGAQSLSDAEYEVGPALLKNKPDLLADYAQFRLRVARKALSGAENGNQADAIAALRREIEIWEGVEACL